MRSIITLALAAGFLSACGSPGGTAADAPVVPVPVAPTCHEGVSASACTALAAIPLGTAAPAARGNAYADDDSAALFGFHVFFDSRFSANGSVRCESCHSVDYAFSDNQPTSRAGLGEGTRNAPTILNAARYSTFFWDGRADSLWSQPLFALENPKEMGFTRLEIAHLIATLYPKEYGPVFGPLPDLSDAARFPSKGAPGDAAFDGMSSDDKTTINRIAANMGKAFEAYMRKILAGPSPVDAYLTGKADALNQQQIDGMYVFASSGCLDCHGGPQLSDDQFHNLGVAALAGQDPDPGQSGGMAILEENPFNAAGPFFDGDPEPSPSPSSAPVLGGFRTPSLRNLPKSAPYGHNGSFATLDAVVDFHLQGGGSDNAGYVGTVDPLLKPHALSAEDKAALIEFLKALSGSYPALPWGQWPNGNG